MLRRYGSQHAALIQVAAHMLTMLASGLWHGANWTFVLWGGLHGLYLSVHRLLLYRKWLPVKIASPLGKRIWLIVSIVVTFHLVLAAWVLFRAPSVEQAGVIFSRIGSLFAPSAAPVDAALFVPVLLLFAAAFALDIAQIITRDHAFTLRLPPALRTALYSAAIICLIVFSLKPYVPFIYFQF
jgi:D-alanyl-lipoteichoic acid acyltransferase DltB (MBOAT superfamily)